MRDELGRAGLWSTRFLRYSSPVASMKDYLDGLGPDLGPQRRLLGALGPRMVDLAVAHLALDVLTDSSGSRSRSGASRPASSLAKEIHS